MSFQQCQFENPKFCRRTATLGENDQIAWGQAIVQNGGVIVGSTTIPNEDDITRLDRVAIYFLLEAKGASDVLGQIDRDYIELAD
jgi:hypothetical protein